MSGIQAPEVWGIFNRIVTSDTSREKMALLTELVDLIDSGGLFKV